MEWPARIAIFACCYAIQTVGHVVFGRNIATEFKYSRAIILGIFESKRRGGEKREWNNDEPGLIGALLCLDTSMNPVKSGFQLNAGKLKMNKIFVLTFQTLIFEIPFPFESLTFMYIYIYTHVFLSFEHNTPFLLSWAHLYVITSHIIHPIRTKFRSTINIGQNGSPIH